MGEVYRGHNIHTEEPVAIKIVLPSLAHDPKIISLFQMEATVLNRLNHEATLRHQIFTVDPGIQRPRLAMEFVGGESLADHIRNGPMPTDQVFALLHRVASGLLAAHKLGVVHRDLSPDNVILQDGLVEHAKIIDFGIAKAADVGKGRTLIGDNFAGKSGYVAPEQLGKYGREVIERSDIYSLGLLAVAACRGEALGMGDDFHLALESRNQVPDLSGTDPGMQVVLERLLQPDPAARPADMAEVLALLPDAGAATPPPQQTAPPPAAPLASGASARSLPKLPSGQPPTAEATAPNRILQIPAERAAARARPEAASQGRGAARAAGRARRAGPGRARSGGPPHCPAAGLRLRPLQLRRAGRAGGADRHLCRRPRAPGRHCRAAPTRARS
jgi:serine/threonine-protein kinase